MIGGFGGGGGGEPEGKRHPASPRGDRTGRGPGTPLCGLPCQPRRISLKGLFSPRYCSTSAVAHEERPAGNRARDPDRRPLLHPDHPLGGTEFPTPTWIPGSHLQSAMVKRVTQLGGFVGYRGPVGASSCRQGPNPGPPLTHWETVRCPRKRIAGDWHVGCSRRRAWMMCGGEVHGLAPGMGCQQTRGVSGRHRARVEGVLRFWSVDVSVPVAGRLDLICTRSWTRATGHPGRGAVLDVSTNTASFAN